MSGGETIGVDLGGTKMLIGVLSEAGTDPLYEQREASTGQTEDELVELGCVIALTFGQQSWIRLLDVDHHQYMAGTSASMAPGFEDAEALAASKAKEDYWAAGAPGASSGAR